MHEGEAVLHTYIVEEGYSVPYKVSVECFIHSSRHYKVFKSVPVTYKLTITNPA